MQLLKENRELVFEIAALMSASDGMYDNFCANEVINELNLDISSLLELGTRLFEYRKKHL